MKTPPKSDPAGVKRMPSFLSDVPALPPLPTTPGSSVFPDLGTGVLGYPCNSSLGIQVHQLLQDDQANDITTVTAIVEGLVCLAPVPGVRHPPALASTSSPSAPPYAAAVHSQDGDDLNDDEQAQLRRVVHLGVVHATNTLKETLGVLDYRLFTMVAFAEHDYLLADDHINREERDSMHRMFEADAGKAAYLQFGHWSIRGHFPDVQDVRREAIRFMASSTAFSVAVKKRLDNSKKFQAVVTREVQQGGHAADFLSLEWLSDIAKTSFQHTPVPSPVADNQLTQQRPFNVNVAAKLQGGGILENMGRTGDKVGNYNREIWYGFLPIERDKPWQDVNYAQWFLSLIGFKVLVFVLLGFHVIQFVAIGGSAS